MQLAACRFFPLLAVLPRWELLLLSTKSVICTILYPTIQVRSPRSILGSLDLPHPTNPADRSVNERVTSHHLGEHIHLSIHSRITNQHFIHRPSHLRTPLTTTQYKRTALPTLSTQNTPYLTLHQPNPVQLTVPNDTTPQHTLPHPTSHHFTNPRPPKPTQKQHCTTFLLSTHQP